jgi:hypothetical protein
MIRRKAIPPPIPTAHLKISAKKVSGVPRIWIQPIAVLIPVSSPSHLTLVDGAGVVPLDVGMQISEIHESAESQQGLELQSLL